MSSARTCTDQVEECIKAPRACPQPRPARQRGPTALAGVLAAGSPSSPLATYCPMGRSWSGRVPMGSGSASPMTSGPCSPTSAPSSPGPTWPCAIWRYRCHTPASTSHPGRPSTPRHRWPGRCGGPAMTPARPPRTTRWIRDRRGGRRDPGGHGRGRAGSRRHGPHCQRSRPQHHPGGPRVAGPVLSYTYGLNSGWLPSDRPWLVKLIEPGRIIKAVRAARAAGAQFVVVLLHWGQEYQSSPTPLQRQGELAVQPDAQLLCQRLPGRRAGQGDRRRARPAGCVCDRCAMCPPG
jgi:hypothetical protein